MALEPVAGLFALILAAVGAMFLPDLLASRGPG